MSMSRKEAILYLEPIARSAYMKSYSEALTMALDELKEQEGLLEPKIEKIRKRYAAAKGSERAVLGEVLTLLEGKNLEGNVYELFEE